MRLLVSDDAVIRGALADLELGLHEGHDWRTSGAKGRRNRPEHELEGDERHVDDGEVDGLAKGLGGQRPGVQPVMDHDPRISGDPIGELSPPDIDRVNTGRPALEEHVAEPAGRRARIQADEPGGVDRECVQGGCELVAAAADVWLSRHELDLEIGVDEIARLAVDARGVAAARPDLAGEDQGLRPRAALRKATLDDELVEPLADALRGGVAHRPIVAQRPWRRLNARQTRRRRYDGPMAGRPLTLIYAALLLFLIGASGIAAGGTMLGAAANGGGSLADDVRAAGVGIGTVIATYGFFAVAAGAGLILLKRWGWRLGLGLIAAGLVILVGIVAGIGLDPVIGFGASLWAITFACLLLPTTRAALR
jgi:hypothetical protein